MSLMKGFLLEPDLGAMMPPEAAENLEDEVRACRLCRTKTWQGRTSTLGLRSAAGSNGSAH